MRGPIDFPYPVGIGPIRCSGILQSYSHVQRPRDRQSGVEHPPHVCLGQRPAEALRATVKTVSVSRGPKVQLCFRSVNRENFPNGVTDRDGELDRLELLERLPARAAHAHRLARRRSELARQRRLHGTAVRTRHPRRASLQLNDSVVEPGAPAIRAARCRTPRASRAPRRESSRSSTPARTSFEPRRVRRRAPRAPRRMSRLDLAHRRTPGVRRRHRHHDARRRRARRRARSRARRRSAPAPRDPSPRRGSRTARRATVGARITMSAPGCDRATICISASRWPRCSVWRPSRPPRCM